MSVDAAKAELAAAETAVARAREKLARVSRRVTLEKYLGASPDDLAVTMRTFSGVYSKLEEMSSKFYRDDDLPQSTITLCMIEVEGIVGAAAARGGSLRELKCKAASDFLDQVHADLERDHIKLANVDVRAIQPPHPLITVVGQNPEVNIKACIKLIADMSVKDVTVMCPRGSMADEWRSALGSSNVHEIDDPATALETIRESLRTQEGVIRDARAEYDSMVERMRRENPSFVEPAYEIPPELHKCIVVDGCGDMQGFTTDDAAFKTLILSGNRLGIRVIFTHSSNIRRICRTIRVNHEYVLFCDAHNEDVLKDIYDEYLSGIESRSFSQFKALVAERTSIAGHSVWVDVRADGCFRSNRVFEYVWSS